MVARLVIDARLIAAARRNAPGCLGPAGEVVFYPGGCYSGGFGVGVDLGVAGRTLQTETVRR
jgi:hypothetical protein